MDLDGMKRELEKNGALRAAASSDSAKKLMKNLDAAGLEQAAKRGDTEALKRYLTQVLATPEGKALAEQVRKAAGTKNG